MEKLVIISDNYHDIGQSLLLTIIDDSKIEQYQLLSKKITVNRQNRLIARSY